MTRSTTCTAPNRRHLFLVGGVAMLAVIVTIMSAFVLGRGPATAADEPPPVPTVIPSETPEPSESPVVLPEPADEPVVEPSEQPAPSDEPVATPVPPLDEPLLPESVVRVLVDTLRLRHDPTVDSAEVGILHRGDLVKVMLVSHMPGFASVEADGYTWHAVTPLAGSEMPELGEKLPLRSHMAWMAVGTDTTAFVEPVALRCPDGEVDLATLESMLGMEHLLCFGDRPITFEGVYGCGFCGGVTGPGTYEPDWMTTPLNFHYMSVDPNHHIGPFRLSLPPTFEYPEEGTILRVTGHFDDARASECMIAPGVPATPIDEELAETYCSLLFVVDAIEVLGVDEDYPYPMYN